MEAWLDHPLVRHARVSLPTDTSALDLLTETLRLMNELEERFPTLTFEEILSTVGDEVDIDAMRERLEVAGLSEADICLLLGGGQGHRRFTGVQLAALKDAFENRECNVTEFCSENDVTKPTLYRLRRNGWAYAE